MSEKIKNTLTKIFSEKITLLRYLNQVRPISLMSTMNTSLSDKFFLFKNRKKRK